jgi:hypothetical protein
MERRGGKEGKNIRSFSFYKDNGQRRLALSRANSHVTQLGNAFHRELIASRDF